MPNPDPTAYLNKQESTIFRKLLSSKKNTKKKNLSMWSKGY